jgi:hypothetical protein
MQPVRENMKKVVEAKLGAIAGGQTDFIHRIAE